MKRDYETNENNETNETLHIFRLFRYFRLFRNLSSIRDKLIDQDAEFLISELSHLAGRGAEGRP